MVTRISEAEDRKGSLQRHRNNHFGKQVGPLGEQCYQNPELRDVILRSPGGRRGCCLRVLMAPGWEGRGGLSWRLETRSCPAEGLWLPRCVQNSSPSRKEEGSSQCPSGSPTTESSRTPTGKRKSIESISSESQSRERKSGFGAGRQELNLLEALLFCLFYLPTILLEVIFVNGKS